MSTEKKERFFNKQIVYVGKRLGGKASALKLLDAFVMADDLDGDAMLYKSGRGRGLYPVGAIINAKLTKSHRIDFSSFEQTDDYVSDELINEWGAEDSVARRTQVNESSRKKMTKENREAWLTALEPLRRQYRNATTPQRRALRQLVLEWLDTP